MAVQAAVLTKRIGQCEADRIAESPGSAFRDAIGSVEKGADGDGMARCDWSAPYHVME